MINFLQGIVENEEKQRMKQKAKRLYKELTMRARRGGFDDDDGYDDHYHAYDDDYDDGYDGDYQRPPPPKRMRNDNAGGSGGDNDGGDRFLELLDELASTISEDSKIYRVDEINEQFGLDDTFKEGMQDDHQQQQQDQHLDQNQQDDPSSKTSDEGANGGSYGAIGEEMIQIQIYVKYFNVHKVVKEIKDIFSKEQSRMTGGPRGRPKPRLRRPPRPSSYFYDDY